MENTTALIPLQEQYNRGIEQIRNGAQILVQHEDLVTKINQAGAQIINKIQENGGELTQELDKKCNDYIALVNQRLREMNERRSPITQMLTAVQKMFTSLEAEVDVKKNDTKVAIIQSYRNAYARKMAEEAKKAQEEAEKKAKKVQESIRLKAEAETKVAEHFSSYIFNMKKSLLDRFNALTLENFGESVKSLQSYQASLDTVKLFADFKHNLYGYNHSLDEINDIVNKVIVEKQSTMSAQFATEMNLMKDELLIQVPSKKAELETLAKADADEKQKIEEERKRREAEESAKLKAEQEEKARQEALKAQSEAAAAETMALFEKEAELSVVQDVPKARESFNIIVKAIPAYVQIFQLWWEHEGRSLPAEKIEKKSIAQMKKFCESIAHKKDIKIESQFIEYQETYKAVAKKS